jgi:hypothetical protein
MVKGNDKRDWPLETLVAVMRNALREPGVDGKNNWGGTKGKRAEAAMKGVFAPPSFAPELFDLVLLYPFTKGIDLTNDGVGYGEQTELILQCATGKPETKVSRRTRTGNFCLHLPNLSKTGHREKAPSRSGLAPSMPGGGISEEIEPPITQRKA